MLGLRGLFTALGRLTAAVSHSADLFEQANAQLERQLGEAEETPALAHSAPEVEEKKKGGRR